MRRLFTGTRQPTNAMRDSAIKLLDEMDPLEDIVIAGHARGIDRIVEEYWLNVRQGAAFVFPAAWDLHGRSAGPVRNSRMLLEGQPDDVVAYPSALGRGTQDMMKKARDAGLLVKLFGK